MTVKLKYENIRRRSYTASQRGMVTCFSRKSRLRLMRLMARLAWSDCVFITLTYGQAFPSVSIAKSHLREFCRRLARLNNNAAFIWRQELQKRGAIHFHIIMTNTTFIDKTVIAMTWASVIGYEYCDFTEEDNGRLGPGRPPFTRIEKVHNRRKLSNYVSKYLAKVAPDASGFNDVPYLHTGGGVVQSVGRQWGIYRRDNLIFALLVTATLVMGDWFWHMKIAMAGVWKRVVRWRSRDMGWSLFVEQAEKWVFRATDYYQTYSFDDLYAPEFQYEPPQF